MTVKFDEDRFTLRHDGSFTAAGTWKLDAGKKPREITLVYTKEILPAARCFVFTSGTTKIW